MLFKPSNTSIRLEELPRVGGEGRTAQSNTRQRCRQIESERKLRQPSEAREMKFSHSIQFNAVPDWSSNYINYSNLKKL